MATCNRPDRITCDAFSDEQIGNGVNNGIYSGFTNKLTLPLLKVKGLQLLRANFVNPSLPLNDYNGQLLFFYYAYTDATVSGIAVANMRCIRLYPSFVVPQASYTTYVKNQYFNSVADLVTALNAAAVTGGDLATYNPNWITADVSFAYSTTTRKITMTGLTSGNYYSVAAADDANIATYMASIKAPKLASFGSTNYATATAYPFVSGQSMNPRLGWGMSYRTKGRYYGTGSILGCATATQVPQAYNVGVEADSNPILLGLQNLNVFCSIVAGGGQNSKKNRNLLANIPIENAPLGVNSYTLTSVEGRTLSVFSEVYEMTFTFTDDYNNPVYFSPNWNVQLEMNVFYNQI
jgi:hypothetical protein